MTSYIGAGLDSVRSFGFNFLLQWIYLSPHRRENPDEFLTSKLDPKYNRLFVSKKNHDKGRSGSLSQSQLQVQIPSKIVEKQKKKKKYNVNVENPIYLTQLTLKRIVILILKLITMKIIVIAMKTVVLV